MRIVAKDVSGGTNGWIVAVVSSTVYGVLQLSLCEPANRKTSFFRLGSY